MGLNLAWEETIFLLSFIIDFLSVLISFPSGTPVMCKFLKIISTLLDLPYSSGFPDLNMFIFCSAFGNISRRSSKLLACSSSIEIVCAHVHTYNTGAGDPNSGPNAYTASHLSPRSLNVLL